MNERKYPHLVELPLPPGGFGSASDAMLAFHREHGIQPRRGRNEDEDFFVTFCFADLITPTHFKSGRGCAADVSGGGTRQRKAPVAPDTDAAQPGRVRGRGVSAQKEKESRALAGPGLFRRKGAQLSESS